MTSSPGVGMPVGTAQLRRIRAVLSGGRAVRAACRVLAEPAAGPFRSRWLVTPMAGHPLLARPGRRLDALIAPATDRLSDALGQALQRLPEGAGPADRPGHPASPGLRRRAAAGPEPHVRPGAGTPGLDLVPAGPAGLRPAVLPTPPGLLAAPGTGSPAGLHGAPGSRGGAPGSRDGVPPGRRPTPGDGSPVAPGAGGAGPAPGAIGARADRVAGRPTGSAGTARGVPVEPDGALRSLLRSWVPVPKPVAEGAAADGAAAKDAAATGEVAQGEAAQGEAAEGPAAESAATEAPSAHGVAAEGAVAGATRLAAPITELAAPARSEDRHRRPGRGPGAGDPSHLRERGQKAPDGAERRPLAGARHASAGHGPGPAGFAVPETIEDEDEDARPARTPDQQLADQRHMDQRHVDQQHADQQHVEERLEELIEELLRREAVRNGLTVGEP